MMSHTDLGLPAFISDAERRERLDKLRASLDAQGLAGLLLGSSKSLQYFTGLHWHASERLLGALVTPPALHYIVPGFEPIGRAHA